MRTFIGGNFKMNGTAASIRQIIERLNGEEYEAEVVLSPPSVYLSEAATLFKGDVCAQNVYSKDFGAYTGELSPAQLVDAGVRWTLVGHSERRTLFHETNEAVAEKTQAALEAGLKVILCIGETLKERETDVTEAVLAVQLAAIQAIEPDWTKIVVAYEPVWAIGTGKVATPEQAQQTHAFIRRWLKEHAKTDEIRIIYGGSVNAQNSRSLLQPDINGFLVGGASLKPEFVDIIKSANSVQASA